MSIEILERAIARLEELKAGVFPGEWESFATSGDHWHVYTRDGEAVAHISTNDGMDEDNRQPTAELIVALSRTVDPLLDAMRMALMLARLPLVDEGSAVVIANGGALARAVLGEVSQ